MSKSRRLRFDDLRRAFRLVGECRDVGDDHLAWLAHASNGLRGLIGCDVVLASIQPPGPIQSFRDSLGLVDIGWDSETSRQHCLRYLASGDYVRAPDYQAYRKLKSSHVTARRQRLVSDRQWYRTVDYNEHWRPAYVDHYLVTVGESATRTATTLFNMSRAIGRPRFDRREVRLIELFHEELTRLIGSTLSDGRGDPFFGLSPRLAQTLGCLLNGDNEKQIAVRLGISRHTVHDYIKALHGHFGVSTRGELHARCGRRRHATRGSVGPS